MSFASAQDLIDLVGSDLALQLSSDTGSVIDKTLIESIISGAEARVLQKVRRRTQVTITQATYPLTYALLRDYTLILARTRLGERRPEVPEAWVKASDEVVKQLNEIAKGEADLPDASLSTAASMKWGSNDQNLPVD